MQLIPPREFDNIIRLLRGFFQSRGYIESHTQNRLNILASCEDPESIATFEYGGQMWPLPQTGQMWLEHDLLKDPSLPGLFCLTTSYRAEKNPIEGRHDLIFPLFEFETSGDIDTLKQIETELLDFLGFKGNRIIRYKDVAVLYGAEILEAAHEEQLYQDYRHPVLITHFPVSTHPFWNMRLEGDEACKIDVIMGGMETIGSAERSCDPDQMYESFHSISDGRYAGRLYQLFGRERVERELVEFLRHDFFPRIGGGIGITRLIKAMAKQIEAPRAFSLPMT